MIPSGKLTLLASSSIILASAVSGQSAPQPMSWPEALKSSVSSWTKDHCSNYREDDMGAFCQIISIVDERPDAQNAEYLLDPPSAGACVDYADLLVNDRMKNDVAKFHGNSTSYSPEPKYECGIQTKIFGNAKPLEIANTELSELIKEWDKLCLSQTAIQLKKPFTIAKCQVDMEGGGTVELNLLNVISLLGIEAQLGIQYLH